MLYPNNIEEKLGFDRIRQILADGCYGPGKYYVDKIRFSSNPDTIERLSGQADELRRILATGKPFPASGYLDISSSLEKAAIGGTFLMEEEFVDLRLFLETVTGCLHFFEGPDAANYPFLLEMADSLSLDGRLLVAISQVIDDKGVVKDNASPGLQKIRQKLQSEQRAIRRKLEQVFNALKVKGYAKEDLSPTIRDGRMVVPISAEHKRHVKGFIHDASSSGQTIYMEPEELLNFNNEIRELQLAERQEIIKILVRLTDLIRPKAEELAQANVFVGKLDFIRAKARLAAEMDAVKPEFNNRSSFDMKRAQHPLLCLNFKKLGKQVVPQDIALNQKDRILLISGPNAGGKSVALGTVGLVQYMFQCGLLVPVHPDSEMGIFKNMLMDFGDDQSLEDDLSTYSSHLTNMRHFLRKADEHTLCLIDEFGTGTEPELGGAIAEAILNELNKRKVKGVITTHYANLKFFADRTEGLINGAMRYNVEELRPLYQLEVGKPGSSFAFEIATNIGLPANIIEEARQKVGDKKVNVENLLKELERERLGLENERKALKKEVEQLEAKHERYTFLSDYLEDNKKRILNDAKGKAQQLLDEANQRIENTIKQIKESRAEKEETKKAREELAVFRKAQQPELKPAPSPRASVSTPEVVVLEGEIEEGDYVQLKGQQAFGEVIAVRPKEVTVLIGELKSNIKKNRLQKISRREVKKQKRPFQSTSSTTTLTSSMNSKRDQFKQELDIRGKRSEEVFGILDDFIDTGIMLNMSMLRVLHGKGDGVLRQLVRSHLKPYKEIKSMEDEHADRGGAGITIIRMK